MWPGVRVGRRRDDRREAQVALVAPEPAPVARRVVLLVAAHALLARARADERRRLERDALVAAEGAAPPAAEAARVLVRRLARARAALQRALEVGVEVARELRRRACLLYTSDAADE